jgi:hypothetical protein
VTVGPCASLTDLEKDAEVADIEEAAGDEEGGLVRPVRAIRRIPGRADCSDSSVMQESKARRIKLYKNRHTSEEVGGQIGLGGAPGTGIWERSQGGLRVDKALMLNPSSSGGRPA